MNYYDDVEKYSARGIDWDLSACLAENEQDFVLDDIRKVLAVVEGENDGEDWRWILLLNDGAFVALQGGCDYTGWDCRSYADSTRYPTIAEALAHFKEEEEEEVWASLAKQLADTKAETWHEQTGKELGLLP